MSDKLQVLVYCQTGKKNAMYTIRTQRIVPKFGMVVNDHYVRNVAASEELAETKALAYAEGLQARMGDDVVVSYIGLDDGIIKRRGKLSAYDTIAIEKIEDGIFPFGKLANTKIEDADDGYILWAADQMKKPDLKPVMVALATVAAGIATERGLYAKREARKVELQEIEAKSNFVGNIGERREFEGKLISVFGKKYSEEQPDIMFYINKILVGDDIVVYVGNRLGDRDTTIKMKATIKEHSVYKDVKTTKVNRPKVL